MALDDLRQHALLKTITAALKQPGAEVFVVGGAVRDALLNRPLGDLDLVVRGIAADELEARLSQLGKVSLVGKKFAVFKLNLNKQIVDIALPRTDASFGTGGYKDVAVTADPSLPIEDDLKRRDFTVNAMAWNTTNEDLIDPYGGQGDLKTKMIRSVGDPTLRFQEDATRMIRAIRFATELGFTIEPKTAAGIVAQRNLLAEKTVSRHVLRNELIKIFSADVDLGLKLCQELKLTEIILPELGQTDPKLVRRAGLLSLVKQTYAS